MQSVVHYVDQYQPGCNPNCKPEFVSAPIRTSGFGCCATEDFIHFLVKVIVIYIILTLLLWALFVVIGMFVEEFMFATLPAALGIAFFILIICLIIMIAFNTNVRGAALYRVQ